jgi:DNA-binding Lrp family transcriptional regulator
LADKIAEEEILHEIENQPRTSTRRFANHLGVSQFVVWLRIQNAAHEIRQNGGILNRVRLSWTRRAEACIANDGRHFEQLF